MSVKGLIKARKRPVEVEAMRWDGDNLRDLLAWGARVDLAAWPEPNTLRVWVEPEQSWVWCPVGHYVVRGVKGEFYPVAPEVFAATYEVLESP